MTPVVDGIDIDPALAWAARQLGPLDDVQKLTGGVTSVMLRLIATDGQSAVLRLLTNEPWRTHGAELASRESAIQSMLAVTSVPAPRSIALDAAGTACGYAAHLMSYLPGTVDLDRVDAGSLGSLAAQLAAIHDIEPNIDVRTYQSWAWEAKFVVPAWAARPQLWEDAFALLRTPSPEVEHCFIHRDFQHRNVLWDDDALGGVVDWVETSMGPAWLDVAHCCTNIALEHGSDMADAFADAYVAVTGRAPAAYFDVMDVVGFLPPPGGEVFATLDADAQARRPVGRRLAQGLALPKEPTTTSLSRRSGRVLYAD